MANPDLRKLPPMAALEFAIEQAFRRFFFGVRLIIGWLIICAPLFGAAYTLAFQNGPPDPQHLEPPVIGAVVFICVAGVMAAMSISVNWHRRILLDEKPTGLLWFRLDGVVWRYLGNVIVILVVLGLFGMAAGAAIKLGVPAMEPKLAQAAKPIGTAASGVIGLLALLASYRLSIKLPAVAAGNRQFGFGAAWRATRKNTGRYLGFTFWLVFTLAIGGAIAGGAVFAQQKLANPWITAGAFGLSGVIGLLSLFALMTVATSHYRFFGEATDFPESG